MMMYQILFVLSLILIAILAYLSSYVKYDIVSGKKDEKKPQEIRFEDIVQKYRDMPVYINGKLLEAPPEIKKQVADERRKKLIEKMSEIRKQPVQKWYGDNTIWF